MSPVVRLVAVDAAGARRIVGGGCPAGLQPAPDYPDESDQTAAGMHLQYREAVGDPSPFGIFAITVAQDAGPPLAVGGIGFHGAPGTAGSVEIGYGVVASWRRRGIATAALRELIAFARAQGVQMLTARVDPANVASVRVVAGGGFRVVHPVAGADRDDILLRFELPLSGT